MIHQNAQRSPRRRGSQLLKRAGQLDSIGKVASHDALAGPQRFNRGVRSQGELLDHVAEAVVKGNVGQVVLAVGADGHGASLARGSELLGFDLDRHDDVVIIDAAGSKMRNRSSAEARALGGDAIRELPFEEGREK